jgi:hypothetical protein
MAVETHNGWTSSEPPAAGRAGAAEEHPKASCCCALMNFCRTACASGDECSDGFRVDRDNWNAWLGLGAPAGLLGPLAGAIVVVSMVEPLNGGLTAALAGGGTWLVLSALIALTARNFTADDCRMRGPS